MDPTPLRIRLLGGLTVEGLAEREIGSRKGRTVLKVLALARGAPVPVDRIAFAVWGDEPPARPADQVGVLVSRLRAVLGSERLPRTDAGYALNADWLDVAELELRVAEAERRHAGGQVLAARAAGEAALALVRGPLLPGDEGEWIDGERAATERLTVRARLVLAEAAAAAGDAGTAVTAAEAVLSADPYDEAALRALMRAHAAAGRPASALAAYSVVRARLAEDLGVPPAPATEALHDALVLGDEGVVPEPPPPPAAPARLAGRGSELAVLYEVLDRAAAGGGVVVAVEGEAGIGKTALLAEASARAAGLGFLVVACRADALGRDLPLQPLLDGLAAALAEAGPDALGPEVDALGPLLGRSPGTGPAAATVVVDAPARRAVLFAALLAVFERLAAGRPLLVVVDDLHAADSATVEWLALASRRATRLAVMVARRPPAAPVVPGERRVVLGPLDQEAVAAIAGRDRAGDLLRRSGGNPLFVVELAREGDKLPRGIVETVDGRARALGEPGAPVLRAAAVLGPGFDLDLLAAVLDLPVASLLDAADAATAAGLLAERGSSYAFRHEIVREVLAAGVTAARRAFLHRAAAAVLGARPGAEPSQVAWHAREGGDPSAAAAALVRVAQAAAARYDHAEAERALSDAVALADGPEVRLARSRVRIARWDLPGAVEDAEWAIAHGAGAAALETAGWAAYYRRDFDAARRFGDEGAERAGDGTLRASCLVLAGRVRHSSGQLEEARERLIEAAQCPAPEVRAVAQALLANLMVHQGGSGEALDLVERALIDPDRFAHPFATFHARFVRALALGLQCRLRDLEEASARLEQHAARAGDQGRRFVPVARNLRIWADRAVGAGPAAVAALESVLDSSDPADPAMTEPRMIALLDLVDTALDAGDPEAEVRLKRAEAAVSSWEGTMAWRGRLRLRLQRARLDLAGGAAAEAAESARQVAEAAGQAGEGRHRVLARCLEAEARGRIGEPIDHDVVDAHLRRLDDCAGLEAWLVTARLAGAAGVDRWWRDAERRAGRLVEGAGDRAGEASRHVDRMLAALRRRR